MVTAADSIALSRPPTMNRATDVELLFENLAEKLDLLESASPSVQRWNPDPV